MRVAVQAACVALVAVVAGAGTAAAAGPADGLYRSEHKGVFRPVADGQAPRAVTYDEQLVPSGARIAVAQEGAGAGGATGAARVALRVRGVHPGHHFGAHVHTKPCGAKPDDSGPHYQHVADPQQPSTDPRYANPYNEVWLDFTADRAGRGNASALQAWTFRPGAARSLVLHEHGTATGHGHAGEAGDRVACISLPFGAQGS